MGRLRDHPRMCGKNRTHIVVRGRRQGSPPHVREESLPNRRRHRRMGITPAHAGRIVLQPRFYFSPQDHPRACGKNWATKCLCFDILGSPPRMREESVRRRAWKSPGRITPAHAGRMSESSPYWFFHWDHPRACGKNISEEREQELKAGSPPRMREEFNKYPSHKLLWRITPAHAGRIRITHFLLLTVWDHPRACGKNVERSR